jgi:hypothetical protein
LVDSRERSAVPPGDAVHFVLASANLNRGYWPFRGILFSLLIHGAIVFGITVISISKVLTQRSRIPQHALIINFKELGNLTYLPILGGGHSNTPPPQSTPKDGVSLPGPQPIVSDFPKPTNRIQTVLQPALEHPPVLEQRLLLPNVVLLANAGLIPRVEPPAPALRPPDVILPPEPELPLPLAQLRPVEPPELLIAPPAAKNAPEPAASPVEQSKLEFPQLDPSVIAERNLRDLLTLSPVPALPEQPVIIPPAEARARFAVSPEPTAGGSGTNVGAGTAKDGASANGATGTNGERGSGNGSAGGAGAGAGNNAFPGITILGGVVETRGAGKPAADTGTPIPQQTSYGLTILSTESSGGGLPNFGVFSNEEVHTVFLDMRRTTTDRTPSWTLEYAVLHEAAAQSTETKHPEGNQQTVVLPFPVVKEQPALPAELVRKYSRRMIIVYAIINVLGKMDQLAVKDSPDPQLNEPVLTALSKWVFRPGQRDGQAAPAKILLGIPLG